MIIGCSFLHRLHVHRCQCNCMSGKWKILFRGFKHVTVGLRTTQLAREPDPSNSPMNRRSHSLSASMGNCNEQPSQYSHSIIHRLTLAIAAYILSAASYGAKCQTSLWPHLNKHASHRNFHTLKGQTFFLRAKSLPRFDTNHPGATPQVQLVNLALNAAVLFSVVSIILRRSDSRILREMTLLKIRRNARLITIPSPLVQPFMILWTNIAFPTIETRRSTTEWDTRWSTIDSSLPLPAIQITCPFMLWGGIVIAINRYNEIIEVNRRRYHSMEPNNHSCFGVLETSKYSMSPISVLGPVQLLGLYTRGTIINSKIEMMSIMGTHPPWHDQAFAPSLEITLISVTWLPAAQSQALTYFGILKTRSTWLSCIASLDSIASISFAQRIKMLKVSWEITYSFCAFSQLTQIHLIRSRTQTHEKEGRWH